MQTAFCVQYKERPAWIDSIRKPGREVFELCWGPTPITGAIHLPKSTWTTGRNRLYRAVLERELQSGHRFDYLVMADDDICFEGVDHAGGLTRFETAIARHTPAIAVPNYCWHFQGGKHLDKSAEVQGIYATDALLNAFHRDVWWVILPYWGEFDSQSWWNSAHIQNRIAGTLYRGAVVSVNNVFVENKVASDYPRDGRCVAADAMLTEMARPSTRWHGHQTKESFLPQPLALKQNYATTVEDVAAHWDVTHRYWAGRFEMRAAA